MDNFNVPEVDPMWDYATVWELVHGMRNRLNEAIEYMSEIKKATEESNQHLHEEINTTMSTGLTCINLIDFHPSNLEES